MWKYLVAAIVAVVALVLVFYPMLNEQTDSACAALERRFLAVTIAESPPEEALAVKLAAKLLDLGKGKVARQLVRRDNPDVPAVLTCYRYYWHSMYDRHWLLQSGARMLAR
ncbi:MAG: hypothetical protein U1F47_05145 [Hyphomicrobiales bacterium]|jgi:hypothetical protein